MEREDDHPRHAVVPFTNKTATSSTTTMTTKKKKKARAEKKRWESVGATGAEDTDGWCVPCATDVLPDELLLLLFEEVAGPEVRHLATLQLVCRRWAAVVRTEALWLRTWALNPARYGPARALPAAAAAVVGSASGEEEDRGADDGRRWAAFVGHMRRRVEGWLRWASVGYREYVRSALLEGRTFVSEVHPRQASRRAAQCSRYFARSFYIQFTFRPHGVVERLCYCHLDLRTHQRTYRPLTYHDQGTYEVVVELLDDDDIDYDSDDLWSSSERSDDSSDHDDDDPASERRNASGAVAEGRGKMKKRRIVVILTMPNVVGVLRKTLFYLVEHGKRLVAGNHTISYALKKHPNKIGNRVRLFVFNVGEKRKQKKLIRQRRLQVALERMPTNETPMESSGHQRDGSTHQLANEEQRLDEEEEEEEEEFQVSRE